MYGITRHYRCSILEVVDESRLVDGRKLYYGGDFIVGKWPKKKYNINYLHYVGYNS